MIRLFALLLLLSSCASMRAVTYLYPYDNFMTDKEIKYSFKQEIACMQDIGLETLSQKVNDMGYKSKIDPSRNIMYLTKGFYRVTCGAEIYACKLWSQGVVVQQDCKLKSNHHASR